MGKDHRIVLAVKYLFMAVKDFYCNDNKIFEHFKNDIQGMERACAFRIGSYFREMIEARESGGFLGYNVDMEYNRQGPKGDTKKAYLENREERVTPDLILHKRGESDNILVCEFKVDNDNGAINHDFEKLRAMTQQKKEGDKYYSSGYKIGIFYKLGTQVKPCQIEFFYNGCNISKRIFCDIYDVTKEDGDFFKSMLGLMKTIKVDRYGYVENSL
jgi:hypothetical protein